MSQCRRPGLAVFAAFDNAVHSPARSPTGPARAAGGPLCGRAKRGHQPKPPLAGRGDTRANTSTERGMDEEEDKDGDDGEDALEDGDGDDAWR